MLDNWTIYELINNQYMEKKQGKCQRQFQMSRDKISKFYLNMYLIELPEDDSKCRNKR